MPKTIATPPAPLPRENAYTRFAYADVFHAGVPVRWEGAVPSDLRLRTIEAHSSLSTIALIGLLTLLVAMLALLVLLFPLSLKFEQLAVIGIIGLVALGPPFGWPCLGLLATAVVLRATWAARRAYQWVNR